MIKGQAQEVMRRMEDEGKVQTIKNTYAFETAIWFPLELKKDFERKHRNSIAFALNNERTKREE